MIETSATRAVFCAAVSLSLGACGGGEIGGRVSGLGLERSMILLNNGSDELTVTRDGRFTFADTLVAESSYAVTVMTQPVGQACEVSNATGTLNAAADSIDDVRVSCANSATLSGTVAGLAPGTAVTLRNGSAQLALAANGPFAFAGTVSDGTAYNVEVFAQPLGANCSVANGAGTFFASVLTDIAVTCD